MSIHLDLERRAFARTRGGLTFIGTWILDDEDQRFQPALAIVRAGEEMAERTVPCMIPLDSAWMWDPDIGDMVACAMTTGEFMAVLRQECTERTAISFVNHVHDMLADLLLMTPMPPGVEKTVIADLIVTGDDGSKRHVELKDYV